MIKKIIIMADGTGNRWGNYLGIPKHIAVISGEKIIERTVRLIKGIVKDDIEIFITSHNKRYEFDNCIRYEPIANFDEIERFTEELIEDDICFLYGDTYYSKKTLELILRGEVEETTFFGNNRSIVGIRVIDGDEFKKHKYRVKALKIEGAIEEAKGWQVYQSFTNQNLKEPALLKERFVKVDSKTTDINTPEEYESLCENYGKS